SSRRRHTRFSRDWSSDVCSSDLEVRDCGHLPPSGGVACIERVAGGECDHEAARSDEVQALEEEVVVQGVAAPVVDWVVRLDAGEDRKSTRLNSSHVKISYAVFCL